MLHNIICGSDRSFSSFQFWRWQRNVRTITIQIYLNATRSNKQNCSQINSLIMKYNNFCLFKKFSRDCLVCFHWEMFIYMKKCHSLFSFVFFIRIPIVVYTTTDKQIKSNNLFITIYAFLDLLKAAFQQCSGYVDANQHFFKFIIKK